jgi:hypothetical protein
MNYRSVAIKMAWQSAPSVSMVNELSLVRAFAMPKIAWRHPVMFAEDASAPMIPRLTSPPFSSWYRTTPLAERGRDRAASANARLR